MNYKAIIFDFDYTLGDSTPGIVLCARYALGQLGYAAAGTEEIRQTIGLSLENTFRALTHSENEEDAARFASLFKEKADVVMVNNSVLYPGVKEALGYWKEQGYMLAIVTTKFRYRIQHILQKFQAESLIDEIIGSDDVKREKPDPEGLLKVIEKLRIQKHEALYVGDNVVDARAADRADIPFAAVLTGTTTREQFEACPHVCIMRNVLELEDLLR